MMQLDWDRRKKKENHSLVFLQRIAQNVPSNESLELPFWNQKCRIVLKSIADDVGEKKG